MSRYHRMTTTKSVFLWRVCSETRDDPPLSSMNFYHTRLFDFLQRRHVAIPSKIIFMALCLNAGFPVPMDGFAPAGGSAEASPQTILY